MSDLHTKILEVFASRNLCELKYKKNIPLPYTMSGIKTASEIIIDAIKLNKKIAIIGDYDVDGVSSICIMEAFFKAINFRNFIIKIPNRFKDGYGVNVKMIEIYNADIFITVDNGITAFEVGEYCEKNNKILIITDHHKPMIKNNDEILPKADAIINPKQKKCNFLQKDICGAVVAWYLCGGIKQKGIESGLWDKNIIDLEILTPFLSLAIISDIMPLTSLNRKLYKMGLEQINTSKNDIFAILRDRFGNKFKDSTKKLDSQNLAFYVTPLLNSAGRVKNARLAFKFLSTKNDKMRLKLFEILEKTNHIRKQIQNETFLKSQINLVESNNFIFAYDKDLSEGVLGIVAAKLADKFNKSAFCFNLKDDVLKGSGRAKNNINLITSIQNTAGFLSHFGGHSGAVGLSLKLSDINDFLNALEKNIVFTPKTAESSEILINLEEINEEILEILESYEPYGNGNEMLVFHSKNVAIKKIEKIKEIHQKFYFKNTAKNTIISGILFNNTDNFKNANIDIKYHIKRDFYKNIELNILEILRV